MLNIKPQKITHSKNLLRSIVFFLQNIKILRIIHQISLLYALLYDKILQNTHIWLYLL